MNQRQVLVIDDEENVRKVVERIFKVVAPDYEVVSVADGFAAIAQFQQRFFDLVVTDYEMPGMDGLELATIIRRLSPETRIVLMSGNEVSLLCNAVDRYGLDGYFSKPFGPAEIAAVIDEMLQAPLSRTLTSEF